MAHALHALYRRLRYGPAVVVVSGLPRSGTSMAMKMLEAGGVAVVADGKRTADVDNPKGYFEDERVMNLHVTPDRRWLRTARGRAVKVIAFLLRSLPPDNNYKVIFMSRNLREIVASQNKMLARRGEPHDTPEEETVRLLERDLTDARFFLRRRHFDVLDVAYRDAIQDPAATASRVARFLGRTLDTAAMSQAVSQDLYRNRAV